MGDSIETLAGCLGMIGMFILILIVKAIVVMLTWNWLVPMIFGFTALNFWQALGVTVLCQALFGGIDLNMDKK